MNMKGDEGTGWEGGRGVVEKNMGGDVGDGS